MFSIDAFTDYLCKYMAKQLASDSEYLDSLLQLKEDGDGIFEIDMKARELEGVSPSSRTDVDRFEEEISDSFSGTGYASMGIDSYLKGLNAHDLCDVLVELDATDNWSQLADGGAELDSLRDVAYWALDDYVLNNSSDFVALIRDIMLGV